MDSVPTTQTTIAEGDVRVPLTSAGVFWYVLANLGYGTFYAFNNFVIAHENIIIQRCFNTFDFIWCQKTVVYSFFK